MEDTHGAYHVEHDSYYYHVLIIIIMEDTHGGHLKFTIMSTTTKS